MFFVYPQNEEPVLIKGPLEAAEREVNTFLGNRKSAIVHRSLWCDGQTRGGISIRFNNEIFKGCVLSRVIREQRKKVLTVYRNGERVFEKSFRRFPRKWLAELDAFK